MYIYSEKTIKLFLVFFTFAVCDIGYYSLSKLQNFQFISFLQFGPYYTFPCQLQFKKR